MFSLLNMNTLFERLIEICRDQGIESPKNRDIESIAGISSGRVTQIKQSGPTARLGPDSIRRLNNLGYRTDWLLEGKGAKKEGGDSSGSASAPFDQNVEFAIPGRRVPIIDYVQAGAWREIADPFPPGMAFEYLISFAELSGNAFALRIKGDSMQPDFVEGDVIVVDPAVSPRPGSFVVAKNGGEEATFKKYRARGVDPATGEDIFELVPLNDDYPTLRSDECRCVIIGTAVEVRKRLR